MDGLLSKAELKEVNKFIHDVHMAEHDHDHDHSDGARSHSYSSLGQHHHGHLFMNPDEYTSRKGDRTMDEEDEQAKRNSRVDLNKFKNQGLTDSAVTGVGLIRSLEKECAFP